jgi:hypothetical protein
MQINNTRLVLCSHMKKSPKHQFPLNSSRLFCTLTPSVFGLASHNRTASFEKQSLRAKDITKALGITASEIPEAFLQRDAYHSLDHCFGERASDLPHLPAAIQTPFWFYNDDQLSDLASASHPHPHPSGPGAEAKTRVQRRPPYVAVMQSAQLFPGLDQSVHHPFFFRPIEVHSTAFEVKYALLCRQHA